ncbi:hypothetical protein [Hankyongella ginsenosidimutans]|uniref:hypothetical protein n=1 Tax=Hankyongella ginsenosidimutans TaxID=1763828 RepID=UPI001CA3383B|nr:hypothetical protein [Hankyongella ginsenosidimutans]
MLKFTTALAFAGAALAAAPAHAALFTIDDFAVIQSVTDVADGVATTSVRPSPWPAACGRSRSTPSVRTFPAS